MKYFISILTVFIISVNAMFAQSGLTAAGLVMTQDGESVIGATVTVKEDPGKGVITDTDGRFKMNGLSKGQTLVISYIGYKDATVKVTKTDERMRIVLEEDISDLDEVVSHFRHLILVKEPKFLINSRNSGSYGSYPETEMFYVNPILKFFGSKNILTIDINDYILYIVKTGATIY